MTPEAGELLNFIAAEQQHGSVLTYSQSYTDDKHERVSYSGTLYAGIHLFKLDECKVMARVAVQDRFSGSIEHRNFGRVHLENTGGLTDDTVYEYRFSLGELNADAVHAVRAVPGQLNFNTSVRCEEDRSCSLSWIQITAPNSKIAETRTVNGIQDIDWESNIDRATRWRPPSWPYEGAMLFSAAIRACSVNHSALQVTAENLTALRARGPAHPGGNRFRPCATR